MFKKDSYKIVGMSSFIFVLCLLIITIGTYSLFSQTVIIDTHLQAGNLEIKLERINLKYNELDEKGLFVTYENKEIKDFTNTNNENENIFNLNNKKYIVPGSYLEATMRLTNNGNVSFDYWLAIKVKEGLDSNLKGQIKVTVITYIDDIEVESTSYLKNDLEIGNETLPLDTVLVNESKTFKVKVEFIHSSLNNSAMEEEVNFDLTVYAVQNTNK